MLIGVFAKTRHWSLSWVWWLVHNHASYTFNIHFYVILPSAHVFRVVSPRHVFLQELCMDFSLKKKKKLTRYEMLHKVLVYVDDDNLLDKNDSFDSYVKR